MSSPLVCVQVLRRETLNSHSFAVPLGLSWRSGIFERESILEERAFRSYGLGCKHFSKIDHLDFSVLKCRACRSELLQNKLSFSFVCFMQLYRQLLLSCNVSAVLDTCSPWLCMSGLCRFATRTVLPCEVKSSVGRKRLWETRPVEAGLMRQSWTLLRGWNKLTFLLLTVVSWEAINDSASRNPGSDPGITLIVSAPWPAGRRAAAVCSLQLISLDS